MRACRPDEARARLFHGYPRPLMERTRPPQQLTAEETREVLKRAAQLEQRPAASGEPSLDLAEVERIGLEAGLSKEAIQRAFVELRAGALEQPAAPTLADRMMGPALVEVQRPIALALILFGVGLLSLAALALARQRKDWRSRLAEAEAGDAP